MNGGSGNPGQAGKDETKAEPPLPPSPENTDDTVAPGQPQSDLVLRKLRDLLDKNEVTPDLERDMGMSRSDIEQFVRKYEKKQAEKANEPGRTIETKPGEQVASDKPSTGLGKLPGSTPFSTRSHKDGKTNAKDQVRDNVEGFRVQQVPPELRGKYEGYVNRLSRSKGPSTKASQSAAPVSPGGPGF